MAKIQHDKYYTPQHIVDLVMRRVEDVIGLENITEFIEPSAGDGSFLDSLYETGIPTKAYDLYPEREDIVEQDYLELDLEYEKSRCVIGNPPFGFMTKLAISFFNKSVSLCDYIAFVLPISFKDNVKQIYKFDLIHSEDLGLREYSEMDVHCCLNIYKRPINGLNKSKIKKIKLNKDVKITEIRLGNKICTDYDYAICSWGSIGKVITEPNTRQYAKEFYIKINNDKYKKDILNLLKTVEWNKEYKMTATPNLLQWQVYKYLKDKIPELE